ncbi:MAG: radical SAM protein [Candidatus Omnitrophota bacterium]
MNIALIRPPKISGAFEKILIQEPINLAYIAAYLKNKDFKVAIWDFEVEPYSKKILSEKVKNSAINIAGITAMTPTIANAHLIAQTLKNINPSLKTIVGGPHVSALPEESLSEFPAFDYTVVGEGEKPMRALCEKIKEPGAPDTLNAVGWRENGTVKIRAVPDFIENLDTLDFPARELFKPKYYRNIYAAGIDRPKTKSTAMFTSRGCPHQCTFCAVKTTLGEKVRLRSARNVIEELFLCKTRFGYNHITFEDTNITFDRQRFLKICSGLKDLKLSWDCQTRVDLVDEPLIKIMRDAGCLKIAYGIESGSPRILKLMKKNIDLDQIRQAFRWTKQNGIIACAFFILGAHPQETKEDIEMTRSLLFKTAPDVFQLSIICPYPGTQIHELMRKENLLIRTDWSKFNFMHTAPIWGTKFIAASELIKIQKKIYFQYLFSPKFLYRIATRKYSLRQLFHLLKIGLLLAYYLVFEKRR